ncbi:MAG: hypothetical protein AAF409_12660 [Pseudomonadota bacterium]
MAALATVLAQSFGAAVPPFVEELLLIGALGATLWFLDMVLWRIVAKNR